jgi:hypothetical protein
MTAETAQQADPVTARLAEIRQREQAATPGPWRWRGNMDNGDPYLTSTGRRTVERADGTTTTGHAGDVLAHIPCEVTRAEARRRGVGDSDFLPEPDVPREPVDTYDQRYDAAIQAAQDAALDDYLTDRWGQPVTEDRLAFYTDWMGTEARKLAVYEVAPGVTDREDPRVYRADIVGIRNPDAAFIAAARDDVTRLLRVTEAVSALCHDSDGNWLEPSSSLPVGEFQAALALITEEQPA